MFVSVKYFRPSLIYLIRKEPIRTDQFMVPSPMDSLEALSAHVRQGCDRGKHSSLARVVNRSKTFTTLVQGFGRNLQILILS